MSFVIGVFLVRLGRRRTYNEEWDARDLRGEGYPTATRPTGGQAFPPDGRAASRGGSTAAVNSRDPASRGTGVVAAPAAARHSDEPAVYRKHELPRANYESVKSGDAVFVPPVGSPVPSQVQTPPRHRSPGPARPHRHRLRVERTAVHPALPAGRVLQRPVAAQPPVCGLSDRLSPGQHADSAAGGVPVGAEAVRAEAQKGRRQWAVGRRL